MTDLRKDYPEHASIVRGCAICGEVHDAGRGLSWDGFGINSCGIYRSRIATLNREYRHEGRNFVNAINSHADLLAALREIADWCAGGDIPDDLYNAARAAIAKAEGRS